MTAVLDAERSTARLLALAGHGRSRPAIALGLDLLAKGMAVEDVILDVLAPVQRRGGELWETNRWSVADEHAATAVVDGVLGALSLETSVGDPHHGEVLVACAEGEHHTMPARMGVELLRADGWEVTFLGGSLPADDLQRYASTRAPDVVVISCTVPLFLPGARRCFAAVGALDVPALGAGAAFGTDARRALRLGARGWLGAGMGLAAALDHLEPEALIEPASPEALALELDREALTASCLAAMAQRLPAMATCTTAQRTSTRTDIGLNLGSLGAAIDLDEDEIFETFVAWLSGVLGNRDVSPIDLAQSLQIIGEVLEAAGLARATRLAAAAAARGRRGWAP